MLKQRLKGLFWAFGAFLMLVNAGLFLLMAVLEERYTVIGLHVTERTLIYLLAIPATFYYSQPFLRRAFQDLHAPGIWVSLTISLRMMFIQAAALFTIYFFLKDVQVSRFFLLSYLFANLILNWFQIYFGPGTIARLFFRNEEELRAVLYGHGALPENLRRYIRRAKAMGINFIGYYADKQLRLPGIEWLGSTPEVLTCEGGRKRIHADVVFAYTDDVNSPEFKEGVDLCLTRGARIQIYSNISSVFMDPLRIFTDGRMQFYTFYDEPLQNPINLFMKRTADVGISLPVVLFILPPLTILVWLMHRIQSPGPLFFKQTRYGMNRRPFTIYKFRTMHVHDRKLEGQQATEGDVRIFWFGKFLRKSSLDEFPQFFNALLGNMSVVGPRPHLTLHDDQFEKHFRRYRSRHFVKPGITGLAQVSGFRGEAKDDEAIIGRVRHDIAYITQWNISREFYIILKTAWQVFFPPKSAY